jgi:hypothetical protein
MFGSSARAAVLRTVVFYTPLFAGTILLALAILFGLWDGGIVLLIIDLILAVLFGYQSIQSLRDLREELRTTRGAVRRIWSKMDLFVSRSHYIAVDRNIFRIPVEAHFDLREEAKRLRDSGLEEDYLIEVEVVHYPHTGAVESVKRLGQVPRPAGT